MKTLIITKNILKRVVKLAAVCLVAYVCVICFLRAAYFTPLSGEDIAVFMLAGFGLLSLFMVQYLLNFVCTTLKRMYSPCNYIYRQRKSYSVAKRSVSSSKKAYSLKNGEAA